MGRMTDRERKIHQDGMGVGMVIAAAILVDHDSVYAEEILGAAGLTSVKDMRSIGCDDYDIDQLRGLIAEMRRKRGYDVRRAKRNGGPKDNPND